MKKIVSIGFLILLCITAFQYWVTLEEQTELPSEQWSRPFPTNLEPDDYSKLKSVREDDGFTISVFDFKQLTVLSCDMEMNCTEERTIEGINTYKNSWSNKDNTYYIKENELIHWTADGETIISSNVENFIKSKDSIIYWTTDHAVITLDKELNEVERKQLSAPIYFAKELANQLFVITENKSESRYIVNTLTEEPTNLFSFQINATESLRSADFLQIDNQYLLFIEKESRSGGGRGKTIQTTSFDLTKNQSPSFRNVTFTDSSTGSSLKDIRFPTMHIGNTGYQILFTANMRDEFGETANKVFFGAFNGESVIAEAVTKTGNLYNQPVLLNDQTIAFYKVSGKNRTLEYSSSVEEKKIESTEVMNGDYKNTFYTLMTILFNGVFLLILSIFYIASSLLITYGTQFTFNKMKRTYSYSSLVLLHIAATLVIQLLLFFTFYQVESLVLTTPFLSTNGHFILLLIGATIVSGLPLFFRYKITEDNFHSSILYVTILNLLILLILIGPFMVW